MQGNMKPCYAFDRCWLLRSHRILSTGMSTPVTFKDIGFFSRDFRRDLLFHAGLTWLGPSRPFCSRNIGWWDFSLEQVGICRKYQVTYLLFGRMKVPHLCGRIASPHFLLIQLSKCFPICLSLIHLAASLHLCPADCFQDILFQQAGNSHWNELAFRGISPTYQVTYLLISAPWTHESTIFCDNVTCFGTAKSCSNRTHLQECFKCSSLLARVQLSIMFPNLSFPHTPCSFPVSVSCRLLSRHSVPTSWEFSLERVWVCISWHFSDISSDISAHICSVDAWKYPTWCQ